MMQLNMTENKMKQDNNKLSMVHTENYCSKDQRKKERK